MATSNGTIGDTSLLEQANDFFICKGVKNADKALDLIGALLLENNRLTEVIAENTGGSTDDPEEVNYALTVVSTSGSIAAGARYVEFIFTANFTGTIKTVAFAGANDAVYSLPILPGVQTYPAIPYTVTAGSMRMTVIK